jgi:hypothetical protein
MKKIAVSLSLLFLIVFIPLSAAFAQTYSFEVPFENVDVYWESNGSMTVEYQITFENDANADPIDYVDVGMPNSSYFLSDITASVDSHPISDITYSPYVSGVALGLGQWAIQPGRSGTVSMRATGIGNVLFIDNQDDTLASGLFMPNYFGSEFVSGRSDVTVTFHLPPGVTPEEPRWHTSGHSGFPEIPVTGVDSAGRITYTWRNTEASPSSEYIFGASFPLRYVPSGAVQTPNFEQRYGIDPEALIPILVCGCIAFFFIFIIVVGIRADRKRRMQYLPPKISIEGHGIKRGLTAPEAGILLEQPMDKILSMILFSIIKKGAAQVATQEPLELKISKPTPTGLREYEDEFLLAFMEGDKGKRRRAMQEMMVSLVKGVANKMRGFSKRETVEFYKKITDDAWKQVEEAGTPKVKSKAYEENLEWTMLDPNYDRRTQDVFRSGPVYVPTWYHNYNPTYRPSASVGSGGPSMTKTTGGAKVSLPTLPGGDFAASIANSVQNFAGGIVGNLADFTGGVTKQTNPPPPPSRSSGGSFSGGGSSCACACAGCACACAGGGR